MSTDNQDATNIDKFNAIMRRTSARLRGSSVPPLDSEQTVNPPLDPTLSPTNVTSNQRGRGRGRGRRNPGGSARPGTQTSSRDATPTVTLTVPRRDGQVNSNTTSDSTSPSNLGGASPGNNAPAASGTIAQTGDDTSIIHPPGEGEGNLAGLISKDNVSNDPNVAMFKKKFSVHERFRDATIVMPNTMMNSPLSPSRRNTVSGAGTSPPKGLHSWLLANGMIVVSNPNSATTAIQGTTASLGRVPPQPPVSTLAAPASTSMRPTRSVEKTVDPVIREVICLDGTGEANKGKTVPSTDSTSAKATTVPEVSDEGIKNTGLVALAKHWEDKIKPLDGYLPLSIMNINWLKMDLLKNSQRPKTSKDKDGEKYHGLAIPSEWKTSFGEWVTAFDLFVAYLFHYKHDKLANRFKTHKENVFAIMRDRLSCPTAFRYDLAIRTTVLTFRNADGKVANPAIRNEEFERNARLDSERLGDIDPRFADCNPYADGQVKSHINPITGEPMRNGQNPFQTNANDQFGYNHTSKPNARSWTYANQSHYEGPGGVNYFNTYEDRNLGGRVTRGRGRGGGYVTGGGRDESSRGRRGGSDGYDNRRAEGSGSWRREERRDDRRGDDREPNGPRFGGHGKAKCANAALACVIRRKIIPNFLDLYGRSRLLGVDSS
ncbi:uncharacterized protein MELLADRAFT_94760 [Melampsora larici-populina 98AG31]|uniref:Uncharacterized protein n=1 Tax=Melampsora larici-populina (strain 98AG31 / pathotype 3-4-7) TaxID=747676 RepID=F4S7U1_MELLP|nr:uncharacterized protein MELLADRAFT_94760 [Melampsora larici-populina 98AG31]EGF99302.1 hypothetical protein MELLADRAFT_94760 [Melampsora larici-populina 98AG31]